MPIRIVHANIRDASGEALILTTDGLRRGMGGTVAHAFARRWPEAFGEIEDQIAYPVPLGRTVATWPASECPFRLVLMAATLHHLDVLPDSQRAGVVASALGEALSLAVQHRPYKIATTVMTGGWRLPSAWALGTMLEASRFLAREDAAVSLDIHVLDDEAVAQAPGGSRRTWSPTGRWFRAWLPEWVHLVWVATATGAIELIRRDSSDLFGAVLLDHDRGPGIATATRSSQSGLDVAEGLVTHGWFEVPVMIHSTDRINAPRMARRLDAAGLWVQWLPFHDMTRDALASGLEEARLLWEDLRGA